MHHAKSDSEVTSLAPSSPPRSPRRAVYYVMSPSHSQHEAAEKMSLGSSPAGSPYHPHHHPHPHHHRYASSPIHHSRESSATRFSASLKASGNGPWSWKRIPYGHMEEGSEEGKDGEDEVGLDPRCYAVCFLLGFITLFSLFSLILWGCSKPYRPHVAIKSVVFESFNVQAGMDATGVPTKMLSINSTVRIAFRNPATFFGVHVSSTPLELYYFQLRVASGNMREFYQSRKSQRVITAAVGGALVPLYGGGSGITSRADGEAAADVPLALTFVLRSRAYVLGRLVKSKFYTRVQCSVRFREGRLGRAVDLGASACRYRH